MLIFRNFLKSRKTKNNPPINVGTSQRVRALHIPNVVVMPFPPLNLKNGVNIWPKTGATEMHTNWARERLKLLILRETGIAPFKKSKMREGIPIIGPPALKLFAGPGLRSSPYSLISFLKSLPIM